MTGCRVMAGSPTPKLTANNPCSAALDAFCASTAQWPLSLPLGVAFSGGADSTALLLAAHARWPGHIVALHVHHGLQAAADGFVQQCEALCHTLGVPLHVAHVDAHPNPGQSPEDAARSVRYVALARLAQQHGVSQVLLAQHADDQVETLLLALSRGAGLPGLSAMPAQFTRHGTSFLRPLLQVHSLAIRQWLTDAGVAWVEDPSNANTAYTRNHIRLALLPALARVFPQFRETFARSARHAAQAQNLLTEVAEQDMAAVGTPPQIKALQQLSHARQANLLRHWLKVVYGVAPSTAQLVELQRQVAACTTRGHAIHIKVGAGQVRREGTGLGWYNC